MLTKPLTMFVFACLLAAMLITPRELAAQSGAVPENRVAGTATAAPKAVAPSVAYSAEEVTENRFTSADKKEVSQASITKVYHDRQGRTRTETTINLVNPPGATKTTVWILDPATGFSYMLDPGTRIATKSPLDNPLRCGSRESAMRSGTTTPTRPNEPKIQHEYLGTRVIEGLEAFGSRITRTDTTGHPGYEYPFVTVDEFWCSEKIDRPLVWKENSPQRNSAIHLRNIVETEADPSLFTVPPDYRVAEKK